MPTITVTVDLRPALAVAAARTALEAAKAEWAGAHLSDVESEDARQKVLDAEAALAAAEAALAATLPPVTKAAPMLVTYGGSSLGKIQHGDLLYVPQPDPPAAVRAAQRAEKAAAAVTVHQARHRAAADAFLRLTREHEPGGSRGIARARRRMLRANDRLDAAWNDYRTAMAEKVRVRRSLGLYVSGRDELAAAGACV